MTADRPRPTGPWDAGLQPERTALAWTRTALSYAAATGAMAKLLMPHSGWAAGAVLAVLLPAAILLGALSRRRFRRIEGRLRTGTPLRPGVLHLAMAGMALALGTASVAYVLLHG